MFRTPLKTGCTVGLVLVVTLWIRSHWSIDAVQMPLPAPGTYIGLQSGIGVLSVGRYVNSDLRLDGVTFSAGSVAEYRNAVRMADAIFFDAARQQNRPRPRSMGPIRPFTWRNRTVQIKNRTLGSTSVSFPHWLLAILVSIPLWRPAFRWIRNRFRQPRGVCTGCGYDLRGSHDHCPECGHVPEPVA